MDLRIFFYFLTKYERKKRVFGQNKDFWNSMKSIFLVLSNYLKRQNDEFYLLILQHHSQVISKLQSVKIKSQGSVQPIKVQNDFKIDISCSSDLL